MTEKGKSFLGAALAVLLLAGCSGNYRLGSGQVVYEESPGVLITVRDCPGPWATLELRQVVADAEPEEGFTIVLYPGPSRYLGHGVALIQCEDYDSVSRLAEVHRQEAKQ